MSEGIVHTAIVEDTLRLLVKAPDICPAFKRAAGDHLELARLGGITRRGDWHNPQLLAAWREQWSGKEPAEIDTRELAKLAFVLGWLSHRAADRQMKPVFRQLDPQCPRNPFDCSVYHDVHILRMVYNGGDDDRTFSSNLLQPESNDANEKAALNRMENLLRTFWQRMLLAMHTFIPGDSDIESWLEQVVDMHQRLTVDLRRYAEAWVNPDPEKFKRFVVEPNFYHSNDPLVRLTRAWQAGVELPDIGLAEALRAAVGQSLYARALQRAFGYVQAASDFFSRRLEREELEKRLEIGRPELAG